MRHDVSLYCVIGFVSIISPIYFSNVTKNKFYPVVTIDIESRVLSFVDDLGRVRRLYISTQVKNVVESAAFGRFEIVRF